VWKKRRKEAQRMRDTNFKQTLNVRALQMTDGGSFLERSLCYSNEPIFIIFVGRFLTNGKDEFY
jgi:hypothetical protein